jgi:hypothetical protein
MSRDIFFFAISIVWLCLAASGMIVVLIAH